MNDSSLKRVLQAQPSELLLLRHAVVEGQKSWAFAIVKHLPNQRTIPEVIELLEALLDLAETQPAKICLSEASANDVEELLLRNALTRETCDAVEILLEILIAQFASIFPIIDDALPYPASPPQEGELEARWVEMIGDTTALDNTAEERFGMWRSELSAKLARVCDRILALEKVNHIGDNGARLVPKWINYCIELYSRAWPMINYEAFIEHLLLNSEDQDRLVILGQYFSRLGSNAAMFLPTLEALLEFNPRELEIVPDWYDDEESQLQRRDFLYEMFCDAANWYPQSADEENDVL